MGRRLCQNHKCRATFINVRGDIYKCEGIFINMGQHL